MRDEGLFFRSGISSSSDNNSSSSISSSISSSSSRSLPTYVSSEVVGVPPVQG